MKGLYLIANVWFFTWLVDVAQVNGNIMSQADQCLQPWTIPDNVTDGNIICKCATNITGVISCDPITKQVFVSDCYCVTHYEHLDLLVIGACPYSCHHSNKYGKAYGSYILPGDKKNLNEVVCGQWNRMGDLCSACEPGFRPPILSYKLGCIRCNSTNSVSGWIKFVAAGIFPPTTLFFLVIILRININSPKLIKFYLICTAGCICPDYLHYKTCKQQLLQLKHQRC